MNKFFAAALPLAMTVFAAVPAAAQNIVVNGNFEAGNTGFYGSMTPFLSIGNGHNNSNGLVGTGCVGQATCIDTYNQGAYFGQLLNTVANTTYELSFWVAETGGPTSGFSVFWGGQRVNETINPNNSSGLDSFRQFTISGLTAAGTSTDLQIHGFQNPAAIYFDDISVTATSGAVPEPATWGMMLLGFGALGYTMRRKQTGARVRFA